VRRACRVSRDLLGEFACQRGEFRVLPQQRLDLRRLMRERLVAPLGRERERFPVPRIGIGECLVAIRLTRLREENHRRGISGLKTERQIQQHERIRIEVHQMHHVQRDPCEDDQRLRHQKRGRAEEARESLGL